MPQDSYLSDILQTHRARAAADQRDPSALRRAALSSAPTRGFAATLARRAQSELAVIAEVKRRSPSRGDLDPTLDPTAVAGAYAAGGAACLSVLTDFQFFAGSAEDLVAARGACTLPVLRKDFTVSEADVFDARLMGADALLLIVAALDDEELRRLLELAGESSIDSLVEVHDRPELERALAAGASMVGVNQRDLRSFSVDPERALELAQDIPSSVVAVAESGISGRADAEVLAGAGYQAVLVGEHLVRSAERADAVRQLGGLPVATRTARRPAPARRAGG